MRLKKIVCLFVSLVLISLNLSGTVLNVSTFAVTSGGVTTSIQWLIQNGTTLRITGTGQLPGYNSANDLPWKEHLNSIEKVSIAAGITKIGDYCFGYLPNARSIEFDAGSSCSSCGDNAFYNSGFTEITLPKNMDVSSSVFYGSSIENIYVETGHKHFTSVDGVLYDTSKTKLYCYPYGRKSTNYSVLSGTSYIHNYAFSENKYIKKVSFPASLATIQPYAFSNCTNLSDVAITTNCDVYSYAFQNTAVTNVAITSRTNSNAFTGCEKITTLTLGPLSSDFGYISKTNRILDLTLYNPVYPLSSLNSHSSALLSQLSCIRGYSGSTAEQYAANKGITFIPLDEPSDHKLGDNVQWEWDASTKHLTIFGTSSSPTPTYTYSSSEDVPCTPYVLSAKYITVENVSIIDSNILRTNFSMVADGLRLGEGLTTISNFLQHAGNLETVTFPSTLSTISGLLLSDVNTLKSISVADGNARFKVIDELYLTDINGKTIWLSARAGLPENLIIPNGIQTISQYAFQKTSIKSVHFPSSIKTIQSGAFQYSKSLETADFSLCNMLSSIGSNAFKKTKLTEVNLSKTKLSTVGDYSFQNTSLVTLYLPSTFTKYSSSCFPTTTSTLYCYSKTISLPSTSITLCYGYRNSTVDLNCASKGITFLYFDADTSVKSSNVGINWYDSEKTVYLTGSGSISLSNVISALGISKNSIENIVLTNKVILTGSLVLPNLRTCMTYNSTDALSDLVASNPDATYFAFANSSLQSTCGAAVEFYPLQAIGTNAYWYVDSEKVLHITGSGATNNYTSADSLPYYDYLSTVTGVDIAESITSIGNYLFAGLKKPISIDSRVTTWGANCFKGTTLSQFVAREKATYNSSVFSGATISNTVFYDACSDGPLSTVLSDSTYKALYSLKPSLNVEFQDSEKKFAPGNTFTIKFSSDSDINWSTLDSTCLELNNLKSTAFKSTASSRTADVTLMVLAGETHTFKVVLPSGTLSDAIESSEYSVNLKDSVTVRIEIHHDGVLLSEPYTATYNETGISIDAILSC